MDSLFFPSHDIALANGVRHFNPPAAALRLQEDLASLSQIWNHPYENGEVVFPQPWGWDWDTRQHLHKEYHVKLSQLPTDEELGLIRQLSSRQTTIDLLTRLGGIQPLPVLLRSLDEVESFIDRHEKEGKPFVLKTPWSSSGRGLTRSSVPRATMLKHAHATIERMGGIMGEEWIDNKLQDFAMLFFVSDHDVRFIGYSLFDNDGTTYRQGYLMSNEKIEQRLGIEPKKLHQISTQYIAILTSLFEHFFGKPWQLGFVGIDMFTYLSSPSLQTISSTLHHQPTTINTTQSSINTEPSTINPKPSSINPNPSTLTLHPCVEMNLRCTMGVVCRLWYDHHQQEGIFRVSPMEENGHFKAEFVTQM